MVDGMTEPRIVLVTGAARGLGLETCRQLAAAGHTVLGAVRNPASSAELGSLEGVEVLQLDITDPSQIATAASEIDATYGRLDGLVNNAGIDYDTDQTALSADLDRVRTAFDTNLYGAWNLTQACAPLLARSHRATVVNVSSGAAVLSAQGHSLPGYRLSKLALNALTLMLASEMPGSRVNTICPGWVATDMGGAGGRPLPEGAAGIVWAALLPADGPTGGYFRDGEAIPFTELD